MDGHTGDPFTKCYPLPRKTSPFINLNHLSSPIVVLAPVIQEDPYRDPCNPSPCGPYSQCRDYNGSPSCSCLSSYIGAPPNCKPECVINSECPSNQACINEKCRDPCPGSCGADANCFVMNHTPVCTCPEGFTGDPFTYCHPKPVSRKNLLSYNDLNTIED